MKRLTIGILAHVDSGKTTLSEAMLYKTGEIKTLGRVDHGDSFLDTDQMERNRGITIFSKQAVMEWGDTYATLLDTPGHVDFSAEMERTLSVLDYAILVISGSDGVQSHTETLWKLLARYGVPAFIFVNKMDLSVHTKSELMNSLKVKLGEQCVDFSGVRVTTSEFFDELAVCDEKLLDKFLADGKLSDDDISTAVAGRRVFPCYFGSALKLEGVDELLGGMDAYTLCEETKKEFGAKVFKIARDQQGTRLTYMKITGGTLAVKDSIDGEKVNQIRIYSGQKFQAVDAAAQGTVCAVTGLTKTEAGTGLGTSGASAEQILEPFLTYNVRLPENVDTHTALQQLKELEEEDPKLHVAWEAETGEIHMQMMGDIQMEILSSIIEERYGFTPTFDQGKIIYKETIADTVEGVGHFEPLRHYAEVHLILEPGEQGSGLCFDTTCSRDVLDINWQSLVLSHLAEKVHRGVLTGAPITDMKIMLVSGRASKKHTEGGDFRQATYRAVRNGLMKAESVLLEPWFDFMLKVPMENVGRAMSDVQKMGGSFGEPQTEDDMSVLVGTAPASEMTSYQQQVISYTKGRGRISYELKDYEPCHNTEAIVEVVGYEPEHDINNQADSVFCDHGESSIVKWYDVENYMHLPSALSKPSIFDDQEYVAVRAADYGRTMATDKELMAIFEKTYGPIKDRRNVGAPHVVKARPAKPQPSTYKGKDRNFTGPTYILVDGYNVIHAWDELQKLADTDFAVARERLIDILCNYQGFTEYIVIVVFDAYKVKGNPGSSEKVRNIHVVYTKEAETADMYIEKVTHDIARHHKVRVVTSDALEQVIIMGHGALRVSSREFQAEVEKVLEAIRDYFNQI